MSDGLPSGGADRVIAPLPGDRSAVRLGALLLAVVYVGLVPIQALVLSGQARGVMIVLSSVSALTCGLVAYVAVHVSDRGVRWLLGGLFAVPLLNTETHVAMTRQLEQTALIMLILVAIGAIAVSRRAVVVGLAAALAAWTVIVLVREPQPSDQVLGYAVQLALASTLSVGLFVIRVRVFGRLGRARRRIGTQRDELDTLRGQAAADLARLRQLLYASPVGLALSDEHGRLVQVNRALCQMVGLPEADLLGESAAAFTHPDDLEFISRSGEAILSSPDGVAQVETRYVRSDGGVIWVWLTLTHVPGPVGEVWTLAHVQDITDRKDSEERLRQSLQVIEAARLVAHAVELGGDPRQVIVEQTLLIAAATSVQFIESLDADQLVVTSSSGDPDVTGTRISLRETSMTGHVWRTAEPMFVDETADHPVASAPLLEQANARSMMWAPVLVDGAVVAIISIAWTERVEQVTELQRTAVDTLVAEAALALMSERLRHSLEEWSMTDPLTGLVNRRGWERQVAAIDAERREEQWPTIIAVLDFDHFKAYNDTHGHSAGDAALSSFGAAVSAARRTRDVVARWGGEEFAIALPNCPPRAAESALQRLAGCVPTDLTCSIGFTILDPHEDISEAIRRADAALYVAKDSGRNQIRGHEETVRKRRH